jgi:hypothetical protein
MFNWINQILNLLLDYKVIIYWLPVIICSVGYLLITVEEYHEDVKNRDKYEKEELKHGCYIPTLKVGTIVGRAIVCFIPVFNVLVTIFKFVPRLVGDIITACDKWLDIPLVPKKK